VAYKVTGRRLGDGNSIPGRGKERTPSLSERLQHSPSSENESDTEEWNTLDLKNSSQYI
jgi:hypothetical protein